MHFIVSSPWVFVLLSFLLLFILLIFWGQTRLGYQRKILTRIGLVCVVLTSLMLLFIVLSSFQRSMNDVLGMFSNVTGIIGFLASAAVAVLGTRAESILKNPKVAIVIPSRVPYFNEMRKGLSKGFQGKNITVIDDYISASQPVEDLSAYLSLLRHADRQHPDYLIVTANSSRTLSAPDSVEIFKRTIERGGGLIFIDNAPDSEVLEQLGTKRIFFIKSDFETGVEILSDYVGAHYATYKPYLLAGAKNSEPAIIRREIFEKNLENITVVDVNQWSRKGSYMATLKLLESNPDSSQKLLIICGNDVMAFGSIDALYERGRINDVAVVGYDGITQAIASVAEKQNPLVATFRTPPIAYGEEAAAQILNMLNGRHPRTLEGTTITLPVDESHLVCVETVDNLLPALWG